MIAATLLGLLFVPLFFVVVKRIFKSKPVSHHQPAVGDAVGHAAE